MKQIMAQDFTSALGADDYDRICANIEAVGYEYWFTADCITFYRNPATGHYAEVSNW